VGADFLMRPGQRPLKFSPGDTIIGVKDVNSLSGGGGSTSITINNPVVRSDDDIRKLTNQISKALQGNGNRRFSSR